MMVDVVYCWTDAKEALHVLNQIEQYNPFFLETPLQLDNLDGYAYLHDHSPVHIAAGELQNTRFEFADLRIAARWMLRSPMWGVSAV